MPSNTPRLVFWIVLLAASVSIFGSDSYIPSLPIIATSLSATATQAKLTVSLYLLGTGIFPLVWGPCSDRFGRKNTLLAGLSVGALGTVLCWIAPNMALMIIGRFLQGAGLCACFCVGMALVTDVFTGQALIRASAQFGMVIALTPALAPAIGGYLNDALSWRANFALLLLLIAITMIWIARALPVTHTRLSSLNIALLTHHAKKLLTAPSFMIYAISAGLTFGGCMIYLTLSPFLLQKILGLSAAQYGLTALVTGAGIFIGALSNMLLSTRFPPRVLLIAGSTLMSIPGLFFITTSLAGMLSVTLILVPIFFFMLGSQFVFAHAFASAMDRAREMSGMAAAIYSCTELCVSAASSTAAALVTNHSQGPLGVLLAATAIPILIGMCYVTRQ